MGAYHWHGTFISLVFIISSLEFEPTLATHNIYTIYTISHQFKAFPYVEISTQVASGMAGLVTT